jgi:hypothetical protein
VYVRIAVAFTVIVTTGGLRPLLLYCDADVRRHKKRFLRCTNAHVQERRASAGRGLLTPAQLRTFATAGLRQPLLVHNVGPLKMTTVAVQKRTCTRAAGVSPPWFE